MSYVDDAKLLKLINIAKNSIEKSDKADDKIPTRIDYVEQRENDRPTFYSLNGTFQLVHAQIANF